MSAVGRRLLAFGAPRGHLTLVGLLAAADAGLLVAQAALLAHLVVGAFLRHHEVATLVPSLVLLPLVFLGRGVVVWLNELSGQARAAAVRSRMRTALCTRVLELGPAWLAEERRGELATLLGEGVEALDAFYTRYLPQLVRATLVPVAILAWVLPRDWVSAAIMLVTLPLVPVFMVLVGLTAGARTERRWRALGILGGHFLDVLRGLPTLRVFNRARLQEAAIGQVTEQHRRATMSALRVAFLSSLVLELAATVSTALVAVAIGLRLAEGGMGLEAGLAILVLTPEVYLPLRRLGAQFHTSMEALAPAERIFEVLDTARGADLEDGFVPDLTRDTIRFEGVTISRPERGVVLDGISLVVRPGEMVALTGPSGAGKTTLLYVLLGFLAPELGRVTIGGRPLGDVSMPLLRGQIGWVPQRPHLCAGTVADNILFGDPNASPAAVTRAAAEVGLDLALDTPVGEGGSALSAGQIQRVALARALVRRAPLLLLDEPTAHLDVRAQQDLVGCLNGLRGVTVILAVHNHRLAAAADRVVELRAGHVLERVA